MSEKIFKARELIAKYRLEQTQPGAKDTSTEFMQDIIKLGFKGYQDFYEQNRTLVLQEIKRGLVGDIKPGLKIVLATPEDTDFLLDLLRKSYLYTEEECQKYADAWLRNKTIFAIKVIWDNRVIQWDTFHYIDTNIIHSGFDTHVERRLPQWFWAQISKKMYGIFLSQGIKEIYTAIRIDRRDYAEKLKTLYGDREIGETDKYIRLANTLEIVLNNIGDWPIRRTVPGWRFEKGGYVAREAAESDLPQLRDAAVNSWGDSPRKELALKILKDDWELCNATILIFLQENKIIGGLVIREKEPTISSLSFPFRRDSYATNYLQIAHEANMQWQKGAGYKKTIIGIETELFNRKIVQGIEVTSIEEYEKSYGWTQPTTEQDITFMTLDIE